MKTHLAILLSTLALTTTAFAAGDAPIGMPGNQGTPGDSPTDQGNPATAASGPHRTSPAGKETQQGAGGMQPRMNTQSSKHATSPATNGGGGQGF
jgi:hypothetical protein